MPPFVPRKRRQTSSPPAARLPPSQPSSKTPKTKTPPSSKKKPTLFDAVDSESSAVPTLADNEAFLQGTDEQDLDDESSASSFSDLDSDEFEDAMPAPAAKRRKIQQNGSLPKQGSMKQDGGGQQKLEDEEDEEMEWEDATKHREEPVVSGDLHLTLDEVPQQSSMSFTNPHGQKKGPSKIERQIRTSAHCVHVQSLMYHNFLRNRWLCDEKLQKILVAKLPSWISKEVQKFKIVTGLENKDESKDTDRSPKTTNDDTRKGKGKDKGKAEPKKHRNQRDWGSTAAHSNSDQPFLIAGDPTLPFLRILHAFWKKTFRATAPGLRKQGYKDLARLEQEIKSFRKDQHDPEEHGERIQNVEELRKLANTTSGSRDVGGQFFTALLRGIGLEARMVANLQPIGFGWNKDEEAPPPKARGKNKTTVDTADQAKSGGAEPHNLIKGNKKPTDFSSSNGTKGYPIQLSDDESGLSSPPESDDESPLDTPSTDSIISSKRYDRDLPYPIYWTEVLSPVSHTWIALDPITLSTIVGRPEDNTNFEPRGGRADRAKQVFAYVVAFSADGSAKDVTVRYLKNHMWPGKTKGVRLPPEKVPIYNRRGKVDHFEEYDWFKTVISCYRKPPKNRTAADDIEDARELVAVKPNRQSTAPSEETLQGYKKSAEFVLKRHLRREEALIPSAKQAKTFRTGKGENEKIEPVYYRADVVPCKSNESWHKEGREVKEGEQPLKFVPMRAVTTIRKREIEEAERESGEKQMQGLYARYQTDWIIPPPIEDGVIPKNAYGNMDVFVPSMVPKGGVHVPLRGTAKICRRLGIDHAEACVGFEFGNRMAVPILTGVVIAKENEDTVIDAWEADEAEREKKERAKREKTALGLWKKMLAGLKVLERVRHEYGDGAELKFESLKIDSKGKKGKMSTSTLEEKKDVKKQSRRSTKNSQQDDPQLTNTENTEDADVGEGGFLRSQDMDAEQEPGGFILETGYEARSASPKGELPLHNSYPQTPVSIERVPSEKVSGESKHPSVLAKGGRRGAPQTTTERDSVDSADFAGLDSEIDDSNESSLVTQHPPKESKQKPRKSGTGKSKRGDQVSAPTVGRRNASRKSKEAVRSQYFEVDSGGDDEIE